MSRSGRLLDKIYILGDLFEYWIGDDASTELGYSEVEETLKKTIAENTQIYFLAGNRDFLVGEDFAKRTGVQLIKDGAVLDCDGETVLLSHGDHLCTDDSEHMAARAELLSEVWQSQFLSHSIQKRIEIADNLRQQSESAKQNKSAAIMDVNANAVTDYMKAHDAHILIHGHTHRPYVHQVDINGTAGKRYVLGDWDTARSVLYFNKGKFYLKK